MSERVLLHVGTPKTGTSFVQDLLFQHRDQLAAGGVLYPADRFDAHFLAALDLMELKWGGLEQQAVGAWDRLAGQVREWPGTAIVSHEILATASESRVRRALRDLGDTEVHVVISARDLVRQIPAEWQENVKHRRTISYGDFLDAVTDPVPSREIATWFWGVQEVPAILARWGADLPPERVHVVTVPKPGAPPTLLWERFAQAFGLDAGAFDTSVVDRSNPSLGVAETALVRELNTRLNGGVLGNEHYRELVRELLSHRTLSRRDSDRLRLPPSVRPWAVDLAHAWVEELTGRGYDVVGDLADLLPDPDDTAPYVDPDAVPADQREDVAVAALVTVLTRAGELRDEITRLHGDLGHLAEERDRAVAEMGVVARGKRAVVAREESSRAAALALRGYRRLRGH